MEQHGQDASRHDAIRRIRRYRHSATADALFEALRSGDRTALARVITLSESSLEEDRAVAADIISRAHAQRSKAFRLGITGVPGVGKSTFIEAFGRHLLQAGHRVAVLAVDPTSPVSHGSILGDKTRMEELSRDPRAFIRPSPSALYPGGVARHTREAIALCEAAGFDVVIVETVGVGQGETAVHELTDFFLLLMLAGAGDQLQGIKRGIMELCDALVITKADGENVKAAQKARAEYLGALHLFPPRESGWTPRVDVVSALHNEGLDRVFTCMQEFRVWMEERGLLEQQRRRQDVYWFREAVREALMRAATSDPSSAGVLGKLEQDVEAGRMESFAAAEAFIRHLHNAQRT